MSSRLNLVRTYLSQSGSSGDADRTQPLSEGTPNETVDSGFQTRTPDSTPVVQRRTIGRGLLTSGLGTTGTGPSGGESSGSDPQSSVASVAPSFTGRGRAQLMQALVRMPVETARSTELDESGSISSARVSTIGGGRGRFIQNLLNTASNVQSVVSPAPSNGSKKDDLSERMSQVTISATETAPVVKIGKRGAPVELMTNYIRLACDADRGIYEHEVRFHPVVDSKAARARYIAQHAAVIGNAKTFDGVKLFLPIKLPDVETILKSQNPVDGHEITIKIIYKRKQKMSECIHFYNILFQRIMKVLKMVEMARKNFDPSAPKLIPQHRLEIWPGYVSAVDEYEGGLMLNLDVSHRVLLQTTVLDHIKVLARMNPQDFKNMVTKSLLGAVILTRYNNKTYRIDDILFDENPTMTFMANGKPISYIEYYKQQYNIDIHDYKQPLLIHRKERRVAGHDKPQEMIMCLIPEICYLTGLTDEMRSDFKVMRDIASFTRITPNQRLNSMRQFCHNVNTNPEAKEILGVWGLRLDMDPLIMKGRCFDEEKVIFGNTEVGVGRNGDFNRAVTSNHMIQAVNIRNWLLIYTGKDSKVARSFMDCVERSCRPMGIQIAPPAVEVLNSDRTDQYVQALRTKIRNDTQIVVLICPTARDDRYAAIKRICCSEIPVPSQVINARTLSNEAKNRAIVQKIILQMNCKLGGTLWSIKIPFQSVMIAGIDTYHDPKQKSSSVSAFVASLNGNYTRWYSRACIQNKKEEFMNGLCASLEKSLKAYQKMNCALPEKIIIFRDGVGDGQLKMCAEYEIPQLQEACKLVETDYCPEFVFIVVQKRINTRMFKIDAQSNLDNPNPGTVLDHTVTRRNHFDYFLVPQSVRQGSVSPTHYIVVHNQPDYSPDVLQRLSYKLCYLYYNWPGSVRVPACCQYAHKMAYLIGQSVKRNPDEGLNDKLFYL
ncbi:protein argonaute-3 [Toxorhynchites rutilus septentrionalis]|uniref:protein argonaute-3 n=1 Tax=Toxorhynchites rutilus septentrionalis TaxID=329112 RepID=UPI00247A2465|nr:protein argonaute-3 [Toxorhynchites rutilus septentrionalis]XP_055640535.1 protein argonaute-3 [Toxorhynchites rutilus septentrionalis]